MEFVVEASGCPFSGVCEVLILEERLNKRHCGEALDLFQEDSIGSARTGDVLFGTGAAREALRLAIMKALWVRSTLRKAWFKVAGWSWQQRHQPCCFFVPRKHAVGRLP